MMEPVSDRRPPITPQLALRVAIFGAVAFALFAIVFFRLWYLQVLSGEQYLAQANSNRVRALPIPAPRGKIVDRNGRVIVGNNLAAVIEIDPSQAAAGGARPGEPSGAGGPASARPRRRASRASRSRSRRSRRPSCARATSASGACSTRRANTIHRRVVRSLVLVPYSSARVKTDVPASVLSYIRERPEQFPGVKVEQTYLRDYPRGTLAAQILGNVGEISPEELKLARYRGVKQGTIVGKDGLERTYDAYLRGKNGIRRVQVDANGRPIPNAAPAATSGRSPGSACACRWTSASRRSARTRWPGR